MKINSKVIALVFGVLLLLSYSIQDNTVFAYLEEFGKWPPTLFLAGTLFLVTGAFFILSVAMITKAESKKQMYMIIFWIVCDALIWPWWIKALGVLLDAML